jgi:ankyrin repeat protein
MMDMRAAPVVAFLAAAACAGCGTVAPSPAALRDDPHGHLIWAARTGDVAAIRELAASGVDLDASVRTGVIFVFPDLDHASWTALKHAAARHQIEAVRTLLEWGASPDAREPGNPITPLYIAAGDADQTMARLLVDAGADLSLNHAAQAADMPGGPPFRVIERMLGEEDARQRRMVNLARLDADAATRR